MKKLIDQAAGIYLRPITREDTDLIVNWRNREEVRKYFVYRAPFTREGHLNWMETMVETGKVIQMIICDLDGDTPLGSVYIRDIDRQHHKGEYGMFVGEVSARGRGVGTAAARLLLDYGFREEKLHRIYMRVFASNTRSIHSCEKAGFVKEGLLRDDVCIDGEYCDMVWMAALNPNLCEQ